MKRTPLMIVAAVALLTLAGRASAVPIELQIGGSSLEVGALGLGDYSYSDNSMGSSVLLEEGASLFFNFGHVDVPFAVAGGIVELTIQLLSPTPDGTVAELGLFSIFALFNSGSVDLEWGAPSSFGYSSGGVSGGILSLNMNDVDGGFHHGFDLTGSITNVRTPVAVSEPGLLLLLGGGLLSVAAARRRKAARA